MNRFFIGWSITVKIHGSVTFERYAIFRYRILECIDVSQKIDCNKSFRLIMQILRYGHIKWFSWLHASWLFRCYRYVLFDSSPGRFCLYHACKKQLVSLYVHLIVSIQHIKLICDGNIFSNDEFWQTPIRFDIFWWFESFQSIENACKLFHNKLTFRTSLKVKRFSL